MTTLKGAEQEAHGVLKGCRGKGMTNSGDQLKHYVTGRTEWTGAHSLLS